jgi:hypothetical protein
MGTIHISIVGDVIHFHQYAKHPHKGVSLRPRALAVDGNSLGTDSDRCASVIQIRDNILLAYKGISLEIRMTDHPVGPGREALEALDDSTLLVTIYDMMGTADYVAAIRNMWSHRVMEWAL